MVTLYGGGRYHLYRYKKYTDVRLVWAPEAAIAFFGGDADNFEYPRYDLDACIFRVYENDQPAKIEHFLKWSDGGVQENELVFVSGNPGRTSRLATVAALKFLRDVRLPYTLNLIRRREILLQQFGLRSPENERRAHDDLFGAQNSRKARNGMLQGLQDPQFMATKEAAEKRLLAAIAQDPKLRGHAEAWKTIERLQPRQAELMNRGCLVQREPVPDRTDTRAHGGGGQEAQPAATAGIPRFGPRIAGATAVLAAPVYKDLEQAKLADMLAFMVEQRGGDDPLVQQVLAGKSPRTARAELVQGTRLDDVEFRRQLAAEGGKALGSCDDPMIQLAKLVDPESRKIRDVQESLDEEERQAYAQIAEATFATQGTSTYPDATFTLRLSYGTVKGYEQEGEQIPPWTTIGGAFDYEQLHGARDPWELPPRWHEHKNDIQPDTQFNFVCTADIIGGNSGSPVVNREPGTRRTDLRREHPVLAGRLSLRRTPGSRCVGQLPGDPRIAAEDLRCGSHRGRAGQVAASDRPPEITASTTGYRPSSNRSGGASGCAAVRRTSRMHRLAASLRSRGRDSTAARAGLGPAPAESDTTACAGLVHGPSEPTHRAAVRGPKQTLACAWEQLFPRASDGATGG